MPSVQVIEDDPITIEELSAQIAADAVMLEHRDFDDLLSSIPPFIPDVVMDEEETDWYYESKPVEIVNISTHLSPDS